MNHLPSAIDISGKDLPISRKSWIVITLDDLGVATANFMSKERGNREGFLQIELNGQLSILPFRGKAKKGAEIHPAIGDTVLYAGPCPRVFELDVRLIETNATTRKILADIETLTKLAGSLPIVEASGVVAPVANLVGSLSRLLRQQINDTHEAVYLGSLHHEVTNQESWRLKIANKKGVVASLNCRVHDLGTQKGKAQKLSVCVANPRFEWTRSTIPIRTRGRKSNSRTRKSESLTPGEYLHSLGYTDFLFEASSGRKTSSISMPSRAVFSALTWQSHHCFEVSQATSGAKRMTIPLQLDFTLTRAELPMRELKAVGSDLAGVVRAMDHPLPADVDVARRNIPSILSQLAALTPHALTLGAFDGIVVLLPEDAPALPAGNGILFASKGHDGWRTTTTQPILLPSGDPIGHITYELVFTPARR